jgi:hypothetical protein
VAELIERHPQLPADAIVQMLPQFVGVFDQLSFGRAQWQRAMALLCLVLLAAAHQREHGRETRAQQRAGPA